MNNIVRDAHNTAANFRWDLDCKPYLTDKEVAKEGREYERLRDSAQWLEQNYGHLKQRPRNLLKLAAKKNPTELSQIILDKLEASLQEGRDFLGKHSESELQLASLPEQATCFCYVAAVINLLFTPSSLRFSPPLPTWEGAVPEFRKEMTLEEATALIEICSARIKNIAIELHRRYRPGAGSCATTNNK